MSRAAAGLVLDETVSRTKVATAKITKETARSGGSCLLQSRAIVARLQVVALEEGGEADTVADERFFGFFHRIGGADHQGVQFQFRFGLYR